jgi:hypothetical protein
MVELEAETNEPVELGVKIDELEEAIGAALKVV